jgi:hypothetical protein
MVYYKGYSMKICSGDKNLWDKVTSNVNNPLHELLPNNLARPLIYLEDMFMNYHE